MTADKRSKKALRVALRGIDALARGEPLALALSLAFRDEPNLGPGERRAAVRAARSVARELRRIDLALAIASEKAGVKRRALITEDLSLLRYLALRAFVEQEPRARALEELKLPGPRRPRSVTDRTLADVAAALPSPEALPVPTDPVQALALRRSVPDRLAHRLASELGLDGADRLLQGLNDEPRFDLRANALAGTREEVLAALTEEGVAVRPSALAPLGLIADDRKNLFGRAHARGLFEVQDEGSQLLAALCGAKRGELVIDFCAGSGGKALALAADVGREGRVVACDPVAKRLSELQPRARRAKAGRMISVAGDRPPDELKGKADAVLVDAPCSGIGGMRREPDLRWRLDFAKLETLPALQLQILSDAAAFVRPGGRLVYATCSPLRAEDEGVVEAFLSRSPEFALADARETLPAPAHGVVTREGTLRTWPQRDDTGAFFGAVLRRR